MTGLSADDLRNLRVMVVEDDKPTRMLTRTFLEHLGFSDVIERENAAQALNDVTRRHFDLIVTDLEMEPMNGLDLLLRVRRDANVTNPYVPVILITQHSDRDSVLRARDFGASAFVAKPVNFENLKRTVAAVLADKRPFVQCDAYSGPDRRRKDKLPKDGRYQRESDYKW
ncbi:response regulator [Nisaea acidiphila]|uniref:Response regulator n=1 Tax=Nisaea acidiphila TaxID=1862145 RepID=A0A9J7AXI4_9PROT|nr:response regulator [Nisaea acidiphila]UUX52000.1 response regulator [Nisaea acidiphila]